jgi:DNA-binding XRE family transcriptional regulator
MIDSWQLAVARVSVDLSVAQLAQFANVVPNSIHAIEKGGDFRTSTMRALEEALTAKGCLFEAGRVGVRMVWATGLRPQSRARGLSTGAQQR